MLVVALSRLHRLLLLLKAHTVLPPLTMKPFYADLREKLPQNYLLVSTETAMYYLCARFCLAYLLTNMPLLGNFEIM